MSYVFALRTYIKCAHGTFVSAEGGGNGAVNANRTNIGAWERFEICDAAGILFDEKVTVPNNSIITLRTSGGQFLYPSWGSKVLANVNSPVGAGFCLVILSGTVATGGSPEIALRSPVKRPKPGSLQPEYCWVTAEINQPRPLMANRQMGAPGAWEKFALHITWGTQQL